MVVTLSAPQALAGVSDRSTVGIGGMLLARRPMTLVRELAARRVRGLTLVGLTLSLEADFLASHGCVHAVRTCFASLGVFGLLPHLSRDTAVTTVHETEMSIVQGLRAAAAGLGFLPMRAWDGTDFAASRPDVATVECPYTGEPYVAFPAIRLDVALLHAAYADAHGNCILGSDPGVDVELSRAATTTIVSTDRIVPSEELRAIGPVDLAGFEVDALVVGSASPTSCAPHYDIDASAIRAWSDS